MSGPTHQDTSLLHRSNLNVSSRTRALVNYAFHRLKQRGVTADGQRLRFVDLIEYLIESIVDRLDAGGLDDVRQIPRSKTHMYVGDSRTFWNDIDLEFFRERDASLQQPKKKQKESFRGIERSFRRKRGKIDTRPWYEPTPKPTGEPIKAYDPDKLDERLVTELRNLPASDEG